MRLCCLVNVVYCCSLYDDGRLLHILLCNPSASCWVEADGDVILQWWQLSECVESYVNRERILVVKTS